MEEMFDALSKDTLEIKEGMKSSAKQLTETSNWQTTIEGKLSDLSSTVNHYVHKVENWEKTVER